MIVIYFIIKFIVFTQEDSGYICCKFCCNIWFGLKMQLFEQKIFLTEQVFKLRF